MIKFFNFKDNYNLVNNKFVNLFKNLKTSYLGFNNTNLGLTKNFFIYNNRFNSSIFDLKTNGVKFFSTSFPIYSSNSIGKGDVVSNLHSNLAFEKTLGVERYKFQSFPFHLVEQSPWPILTSFTLFLMACSAVLYFQGFYLGGELLSLGFVLTASAMALWFRDCVIEGTIFFNLHSINFVVLQSSIKFSVFPSFLLFHLFLSPPFFSLCCLYFCLSY